MRRWLLHASEPLPQPDQAGFYMYTPGAALPEGATGGHTLLTDEDGQIVLPVWGEFEPEDEDASTSEVLAGIQRICPDQGSASCALPRICDPHLM